MSTSIDRAAVRAAVVRAREGAATPADRELLCAVAERWLARSAPLDERMPNPGYAYLHRAYHVELKTQAQIADELGVGTHQVAKWMRELGIPASQPRGTGRARAAAAAREQSEAR